MPTYVSCRYAPPPPPGLDFPQMIICVTEEGDEHHVPPDSTEGSWKEFVEKGGEVEPYEEPA